jgi:TRAP transporter TAXI family solute receptor
LRIKFLFLGLALLRVLAASQAEAGGKLDDLFWLGVIAGPPSATETVLAADMASLFTSDTPLRVLPMLGDAGAGNIAMLLEAPDVDLALVSTDALAEAAAKDEGLEQRLELVARLSPQEVHIVARADIGDLADLAGKDVSFGPAGSSSAVAARSLFAALAIEVKPLGLDPGAAIERLKQGTIAAAVIVGGKPTPLIAGLPANRGIHFLPLAFAALQGGYLPARIEHADYPDLIPAGSEIQTVATGTVLLAARAKHDVGSAKRIARFVDTVFSRFAELKAPDRHPKWREDDERQGGLVQTIHGMAAR